MRNILYSAPHLPQGAPTSPAIANLCAYRVDLRLSGLARSAGAGDTRYADDLAFSGGDEFARSAERYMVWAMAILLEEGFEVHHRKTRIMRQGVWQHLAGRVVNSHLKAILTNCVHQAPPVRTATHTPISALIWTGVWASLRPFALNAASSCAQFSTASIGPRDNKAMNVDVLIAGGGPAGLEAASSIASRGYSAMVLEQDSEVGSPTRTSGGTFVKDMVEFGIPERFYHKVSKCRFFSPSNSATFAYDDEPIVCVIDVRGTFQFLAERAAKAGAAIRPATTALETLKDPTTGAVTGVRARMGNRTFEIGAKIVIDATGYKASMVKSSKVTCGSHRFGVGAEYDLYAPEYDRQEVVLIVGSQIAPNGYAWFCPWGDKRVRAGVGVIHPDSKLNPEVFLDKLIAQAADWGVNLKGAQPIEYHYGLIPSEGMIEPFVGDGILAAGDSAGQPSQLLGEGIRWALFAGRMAGEVCAEALACGDYSAKFLKRYQDRWMKKYGRDLKIAYEINKRIAAYDDAQWDNKVEMMKQLSPPQFARALGSDFSPMFWAGLALTKPGLLREGVRKLISMV